MKTRSAVSLLALGLLSACSSIPSPFPVRAAPTDIAAMEGVWEGEYVSPSTGRSGSIRFTIAAGRDTAEGEVVMIPRGSNTPVRPHEMSDMQLTRSLAEILTIRLAEIEGGQVRGMLTAYRDPECGCAMYTTFTGRMIGNDVLEGSFVATSPELRIPQRGTWKVTRRKTAP